jgi:phytanoyl-CoA hydroxylase
MNQTSLLEGLISKEDIQLFQEEGYIIIRNLFSEEEIAALRTNFMNLHAQGEIEGCFKAEPIEEAIKSGNILSAYPRMMHPHRVNEEAMRYMLDPRVFYILKQLLGEEAVAAQSMFYFKPPGAKGQALHQDNFYLKVEPGTCIAAWTAIDDADEANGGLFVVPNSQKEEIQCPHEADPQQSFTKDEVDIPDGLQPIPTDLKAGDVMFFNGNMIHGSYPNLSEDRFRRAFICHYAGGSVEKIGKYYQLHAADGRKIERETNEDGGPCGVEFDITGPH